MVMTERKPRLTYDQILEGARALSPEEQDRLRAELKKKPGVYILHPTGDPEAIRRGRELAQKIRKEVNANMTGTLEETMRQLRGLSWS